VTILLCALLQHNPKVGDIAGNCRKLAELARKAASLGASLAVCPEMAVIGYPPRDLLMYQFLLEEVEEATADLALRIADLNLTLIMGSVAANPSGRGRSLQNVALVVERGRVSGRYAKRLLPTYDVFDEARYFEAGDAPLVVVHRGLRLALTICEDIWNDFGYWPRPMYRVDPLDGHPPFEVLVNLSASPFSVAKHDLREDLMGSLCRRLGCQALYVNQAGANDELIFDGRSFHLGEAGEVLARARAFEEDLVLCDLSGAYELKKKGGWKKAGEGSPSAYTSSSSSFSSSAASATVHTFGDAGSGESGESGATEESGWAGASGESGGTSGGRPGPGPGPEEEAWAALTLGVRDYCRKNNLKTVVVGLSGGIDSALTAAIAAEAVGPENVGGILMPSPYSSDHSLADAEELCGNLGLGSKRILRIREAMVAFADILAPTFHGLEPDTAEENIQARIRGVLLMAVANKFGSLLLTTGNKSEIAVGYCTIYGDMCGALAVIGDLYKTEVFRLARWLNASKGRIVIPENTIRKPPSAELRPNQTDQDSLPPYEELDEILKFLIEDREGPAALEARGFDVAAVRKVANLVRLGEFKRRQGAPVLKITNQSFGVGWRMPITCASVFEVRKPGRP
jgi:NAD+ synthetase